MNYNILADNTNFNNTSNSNNNVNHQLNSTNGSTANCVTMNISNSLADLAALSSITTEVKTADIRPDNEFGNLFRGLSSVIDIEGIALDSFNSILERQASKRDGKGGAMNAGEATVDLSDLILQGQSLHHQATQPQQTNVPLILLPAMTNENMVNGGGAGVRKQAEKPAAPSKMITRSSSEARQRQMQNAPVQIQVQQEPEPSKMNTRRSNRQTVNVKRLSTGSDASASTSGLTDTPKTERRGRKPASMLGNPESQTKTEKMKQAAKAQLQVEEDKLARFGNKFVIKNTNEYEERRKKNNDAVKKCREKNAEQQKEREEKMSRLNEENRRLQQTVDNLTKELNVLKNIIKSTTPLGQLPPRIQSILKEEKDH